MILKLIIGIIALVIWLVYYIKLDMYLHNRDLTNVIVLKSVAVDCSFIVGILLISMFIIG